MLTRVHRRSSITWLVAPGLATIAVTYGLARFAYGGLFLPEMRESLELSATVLGLIGAGSCSRSALITPSIRGAALLTYPLLEGNELRVSFFGNRPPFIPEPGQRVRLRTARGRWRGSFRAVSEPYTEEGVGVVIRVTEEREYRAAFRESRRAVNMPWPARQMEVISSFEGQVGEGAQELLEPSRTPSEGVDRREVQDQEPSKWSWWRRVFGG